MSLAALGNLGQFAGGIGSLAAGLGGFGGGGDKDPTNKIPQGIIGVTPGRLRKIQRKGKNFDFLLTGQGGIPTTEGFNVFQNINPGEPTEVILRRLNSFGNQAFDSSFGTALDVLRRVRGEATDASRGLAAVRSQTIRDAAQRSISNLRDNLSRRRVQGSSFAGDALSRAELEAGRAIAEQDALGVLQQLDVERQIVLEEANVASQALQREFKELEAFLNVAGINTAGFSAAAQVGAQLQAQSFSDAVGNSVGGATLLADALGKTFGQTGGINSSGATNDAFARFGVLS